MPNRLIRDGILSSEAVCSLSWAEEVFYRRLMSVADDHGRFHAAPKLLRAACYPQQIDKVSDADIGKWITACVTAGLVSVYPAQDGKRYIQILKFGQQVRAKSKFPEPADVKDEQPKAPDINCKQVPANAHLDVFGDEGDNPPTPKGEPEGFKAFWDSWPRSDRKQARGKCFDAWRKGRCELHASEILRHVDSLKRSQGWLKDNGQFVPAPLVYLNGRRWEGAETESAQPGLQLVGGV